MTIKVITPKIVENHQVFIHITKNNAVKFPEYSDKTVGYMLGIYGHLNYVVMMSKQDFDKMNMPTNFVNPAEFCKLFSKLDCTWVVPSWEYFRF
ncbi:hypothetical protein Catovirus_1_381 [Catovirus CTV1]|uniref:Uncharacterized protein n=1 Tax=Catovirus CTV1 TaxID=1977631 RepID=A0A1V0S9F5_9VIRU|nr:hypothetical protein Catovirus_1_381 [Catovirus CTV1]